MFSPEEMEALRAAVLVQNQHAKNQLRNALNNATYWNSKAGRDYLDYLRTTIDRTARLSMKLENIATGRTRKAIPRILKFLNPFNTGNHEQDYHRN